MVLPIHGEVSAKPTEGLMGKLIYTAIMSLDGYVADRT